MSKLFNVGGYIRLSVENTAYDTESESIENQREMLSRFISAIPNWLEEKFYIDNGFSGGNFQRPAFLEMMNDVRSKRVNLILVKDLSRFGRNYLECGRYLEEELPALGCRFVSLSEGIDTDDGENDIIPFLNAMNDYYLKNLSDKIRLTMAAKARNGQKISGTAPYGYKRDLINPTNLIIDEYSSGIVRKIFDMRKQGNGYGAIVKTLNTTHILPPRLYGSKSKTAGNIKTRLWTVSTVQAMLRKEIYLGHAVQLVNKIVSYRNKREVKRSPDEHIRVENTYPAIIDRETWEAVQAVNNMSAEHFAKKAEPQKHLFSGIIFCTDCNAPMIVNRCKNNVRYFCKTYGTTGTGCTRRMVSEAALIKIVKEQLHNQIHKIILDEFAVLEKLKPHLSLKTDKQKEIRLLKQQHSKQERITATLYEDRVTGIISEETYSKLAYKNETELTEIENRLALLEKHKQEQAERLTDTQEWLNIIKEKSDFTDLTRDLLNCLVKRVEVGEREVVGGIQCQNIKVVL